MTRTTTKPVASSTHLGQDIGQARRQRGLAQAREFSMDDAEFLTRKTRQYSTMLAKIVGLALVGGCTYSGYHTGFGGWELAGDFYGAFLLYWGMTK